MGFAGGRVTAEIPNTDDVCFFGLCCIRFVFCVVLVYLSDHSPSYLGVSDIHISIEGAVAEQTNN